MDEALKCNNDYKFFLLGLKDGDSDLEKILLDLDNIQSRVRGLRTQLGEVMDRNSEDISFTAANFCQGDPPASCARSLSCCPANEEDAMHNHGSDYELEVPGSAVSSHGDVSNVDAMECNAGQFLPDASLHRRPARDKDVRLL